MANYGSLVPESEAHTYVENYKALRGTLITEVLPWVPDYAPQVVKDSVAFHKSDVNAFLFDAALIKELFEGSEPALYFAVFLGASGTNPTVVCAGLREVDGDPNMLTTSSAEGAPELPGLLHNVKYPSNANGAIPKP